MSEGKKTVLANVKNLPVIYCFNTNNSTKKNQLNIMHKQGVSLQVLVDKNDHTSYGYNQFKQFTDKRVSF